MSNIKSKIITIQKDITQMNNSGFNKRSYDKSNIDLLRTQRDSLLARLKASS